MDAIERQTLTVSETARLLGVGRNQAYQAIQRGELPSIRVGRRVLVPVARLRVLLEGNEQPVSSHTGVGLGAGSCDRPESLTFDPVQPDAFFGALGGEPAS